MQYGISDQISTFAHFKVFSHALMQFSINVTGF